MKKSIIWIILALVLVCGAVLFVLKISEPHTHSFAEWTISKQATCTEPGERARYCSCGEKEREDIAPTGHISEFVAGRSPTLSEEGLTDGEKCSVCGAVLVAQEIIPKAIEWDGTVAESFDGGSGTADDPYLISDGRQLALLAQKANHFDRISWGENCVGQYYRITRNIYLGGLEWVPIGNSKDNSVSNSTRFCGYVDGNNCIITNFKITASDTVKSYGLFGYIYNGSVSNLIVTDFVINIDQNNRVYAGGLAGHIYSPSADITNCYASGSINLVSGEDVIAGILVGSAYVSTIDNCYSDGSLTVANKKIGDSRNDKVRGGGLIGNTANMEITTISNCHSKAQVAATARHGDAMAGGLIGEVTMHKVVLTNCYAEGNVCAVSDEWDSYAGGLLAKSSGWVTIDDSYSSSDVQADGERYVNAGGFVGSFNGEVKNCYATGRVSADNSRAKYIYIGGFAGYYSGQIECCRASGDVNADSHRTDIQTRIFGGGLFGYSSSAKIKNCYATGGVSIVGGYDASLGGLIGDCYLGINTAPIDAMVEYCYASGDVVFSCYDDDVVKGYSLIGGLMGDCNTYVEYCYSTGNISITFPSSCDFGCLFGEYYATHLTNYRYEGQSVTLNGKTEKINNYGTPCTLEQLNDRTFYTDKLLWDNAIWNFSDLDFENGKTPTFAE